MKGVHRHWMPPYKHLNWPICGPISLDASDTSDGTQTSTPLGFKKKTNKFRPLGKLATGSSFGICNVNTLLPCAIVDNFFAFVLADVMRRAAAHADGPNEGGGDERGGGRTLTRFDRGVIDCCREGAPSRWVGTRQSDSPEALFVADGSQLMSYLGQSPVTIACTGEKQGEEGSGGRILITIRRKKRGEKRD